MYFRQLEDRVVLLLKVMRAPGLAPSRHHCADGHERWERARRKIIEQIQNPLDITLLENAPLIESERFPNRMFVLILHQKSDSFVLCATIKNQCVQVGRRVRDTVTVVGVSVGPTC